MKTKVIGALAFILAGCNTMGQLDEGLGHLVGQRVDAAVAQLGFPSSERTVAGMRLVEWGHSRTDMMILPTTSTTTGMAQTGMKTTSFTGTTNSSVPLQLNYFCTITLQVDDQGIIKRYQYDGNPGGCRSYIQALKANARG